MGELNKAYHGNKIKKTREERGLKTSLEAASESLFTIVDASGQEIEASAHELLAHELVKQAINPKSKHYKFAVSKMLEYLLAKPGQEKEEGEQDAKTEINDALRLMEQRKSALGITRGLDSDGQPYEVEDL